MVGANQNSFIADQKSIRRPVEAEALVGAGIVISQNLITDPEQHHEKGVLTRIDTDFLTFCADLIYFAQELCH